MIDFIINKSRLLYCCIFIILLAGGSAHAQTELYPDFVEVETFPDRVEVDETGRIRFLLVQGDYVNGGARAMMREDPLPSRLNKNEWVYYSFGVDVTTGWPIEENYDAVIVQWRNGDGSPYCSIHLIGDQVYIKINDPVKKWYYKASTTGVNEILINVIWSEKKNGRLMVQINGDLVQEYSGPTLNDNSLKPELSFGIYRPQWNELNEPENQLELDFTHFEFGTLDNTTVEYRIWSPAEGGGGAINVLFLIILPALFLVFRIRASSQCS